MNRGNKIGDNGAKLILDGISQLKKLVHLNLNLE